jgi:cysteinyl-tRNA synthetase
MGYPGWHLECSAMSTKYLSQPFDIHGGGMENKFPHHECEIAQSEAANGVQFAKYWLHNNMVTVDGQKMGKSLGNFITLKQTFTGAHEKLSKSYDPLAVRQLILNSHYRSPIDFSDAALFAAQSGYEKITKAVFEVRMKRDSAPQGPLNAKAADELGKLRERFEQAMNNDLNTSVALAVIFDLVRLANSWLEDDKTTKETLVAIDGLFLELGGNVLGIIKHQALGIRAGDGIGLSDDANVESVSQQPILPGQKNLGKMLDDLVKVVIEERAIARQKKDFVRADALRQELDRIGIVLEDKSDGTSTWRIK